MRTARSMFLAGLLASCAPSLPTHQIRQPPLPSAFERAAAGASAATVDWRAYFADDALAALIDAALAGNLDLQIALQRIERARAGVRASTGALLPQVSAFGSGSVTRFGKYTPDGAGNASTEITPGRTVPNPLGELALGLEASWEVDLWRRLKDLRGAARARYLASIEGANLVITNLVADVAVLYVELLALDHVRDVLHETIARQTQAREMIVIQKEAGRANELAVQQFEAQLASTYAMDAVAAQQTRALENQLNVLLGRLPRTLPRVKEQLLREVAPTIATGVPSELLRNRPDIRAAELEIQATRFDVDAARAAFYPNVSLSAEVAYSAFDPRFLFSTPASIVGSIVGGIVAPLINRRAIEATFAAANASQIEAMYAYQRVVLTGFAEVVTGLSALERGAEVIAHRTRKKTAVAGTVDAADALFRAGKASYLEVLLAQQNTLEAELELIEALRVQRVTSIQLYKALGGGWRGQLRTKG